MKDFLIQFALVIVVLAAWFAFKSIRRMVGIARGRVSMSDLSLADIQASRGLDMHPAFGNPMMLAIHGKLVHPVTQFLRRWLIYFPLAWLTNIISPLTWLFALPAAAILWFIER
jgi:hypothetical protein